MSSLAYYEHVKEGLALFRVENRTFRRMMIVFSSSPDGKAKTRGRSHKEGRLQPIIIKSF